MALILAGKPLLSSQQAVAVNTAFVVGRQGFLTNGQQGSNINRVPAFAPQRCVPRSQQSLKGFWEIHWLHHKIQRSTATPHKRHYASPYEKLCSSTGETRSLYIVRFLQAVCWIRNEWNFFGTILEKSLHTPTILFKLFNEFKFTPTGPNVCIHSAISWMKSLIKAWWRLLGDYDWLKQVDLVFWVNLMVRTIRHSKEMCDVLRRSLSKTAADSEIINSSYSKA